MSARAELDLTPVRRRFVAGLDARLISITEQFLLLEREPGSRRIDILMREFHSLAGTAGTLGIDLLSHAAARAELTCVEMVNRMRHTPHDLDADLAGLEQCIIEVGRHVASAEAGQESAR